MTIRTSSGQRRNEIRTHLVALVFLLCAFPRLAVADSGPLISPSTWDHIALALNASYVEGETEAGFGDYPLYSAGSPCLYATYSSIEIMHLLAPSRLNADALADWVRSLQTSHGGFVDPNARGGVPEWAQTRWACWSLAMLGRSPTDPSALLDFLLCFKQETGLFQYDADDTSIPEMERDSADVAQLLMSPFLADLPEAKQALTDLADYARENLSVFSDVDATPMLIWGADHQERRIWGLLQLVCLLLPDEVPEDARNILRLALENPPSGGADFYTASTLYSLLQRAHEIAPALEFDLRPILDYLANSIEPAISPLGGFGGVGAFGGGWIDPAMTWGVVGLYEEAGIPYPFKNACLEFLNRYALPQGWIEIIHVFPHPLSTWEAIELSRYGDLDVASKGKLLNYGEAVLADPESDLEDLYCASLIVESTSGAVDTVPDVLIDRIQTMSLDDLESRADVLTQIADDFPQVLGDKTRSALRFHLQLCADNVDRLSVDRIWEVTVLQPLLGEELVPREALLSLLDGLAFEGGFLDDANVPTPTLLSTQLGVDCLVRLNALDSETRVAVRQFVEACRTETGYLQRPLKYIPGDARQEYLHYALQAMEILASLDHGENSMGPS